jgi:hypothetical protein
MARALSSTIGRIERKRSARRGDSIQAVYMRAMREMARDQSRQPQTQAMPPPPPTVIEMPVAAAPPEPEPVPEPMPEPMGGQPTEFPEPIRPVTWRQRGPQDWADDSEDMVGRCLTDYDPLADEDDDA